MVERVILTLYSLRREGEEREGGRGEGGRERKGEGEEREGGRGEGGRGEGGMKWVGGKERGWEMKEENIII